MLSAMATKFRPPPREEYAERFHGELSSTIIIHRRDAEKENNPMVSPKHGETCRPASQLTRRSGASL